MAAGHPRRLQLSDKDRLYFRYNMDRGVQATGTDPINPAFNANSVQPQYGGQMGYTRVISPTMVNQLLLSGFLLLGDLRTSEYLRVAERLPHHLGVRRRRSVHQHGRRRQRYPPGRKVRQHQLIDDYSITHGAHVFKFGVNFRQNCVSTYACGPNTSGLLHLQLDDRFRQRFARRQRFHVAAGLHARSAPKR